jgi:hypothetical protein
MAELDKEDSYGDIIVHGLELDDGTYINNHHTELEHENGTRFTWEARPMDDYRCRVFGWGYYGIEAWLSVSTIQEMYDDGVLEIVDP